MSANAALAALAFFPGLAVGSFLNVVAARLPRGRSVVAPASACPTCETEIAWYDNIPVVSYVVLRGHCRSCGARIGVRYPLLELTTAILVALNPLVFGLTPKALVGALFCVVLVVISAIDLEHRIIPNRIVVPAAAVALVAQTALHPSPEWAVAGFCAALFLFVAAVAYPGGMGMGDVKLALLMGAVLGRSVAVALMVGMFAALVPSLFLLVRHGAAARKMGIPFGPFLALGSVVALFVGDRLLDAYLNVF
jgi:leader peptidase (prepilin peptidase)/N-methyltransferase